jgi:hypothetical protein
VLLADAPSVTDYIGAIAAATAAAIGIATFFVSRSGRKAAQRAAELAERSEAADAQEAANRVTSKAGVPPMSFGTAAPGVTVYNGSGGDISKLAVVFDGLHAPATRPLLHKDSEWNAVPHGSTDKDPIHFEHWILSFTDRFGHRWTRDSDHEAGPATRQS